MSFDYADVASPSGYVSADIGGTASGSTIVSSTLNGTKVNAYALITAITSTTITINGTTKLDGEYAHFEPHYDVLIHVSATMNSNRTAYLGKWLYAHITAVDGNVLTINKDVTSIIPASEFQYYYVQAIAVPIFKRLVLGEGMTLTPPAYDATKLYGGIIAIKCKNAIHLLGGHIDLASKGIPVASKSLRPWLKQELEGKLDTDKYAGWENAEMADRAPLNVGDGAAFLFANWICNYTNYDDTGSRISVRTSRIGNPSSKGVVNCRGAADSANTPTGVTNIGGSTIFLCDRNFTHYMVGNTGASYVSKYRSTSLPEGQGLARAYFSGHEGVSDGADDACVIMDKPNNVALVKTEFNIRNFGKGTLGDVANPTKVINTYAQVTAISADRKMLTIANKTTNGLATFKKGGLVVVVGSSNVDTTSTNRTEHGKMTMARILAVTSTTITLDSEVKAAASTTAFQVIAVPEFNNFTLSTEYKLTPAYSKGRGGICALVCKNSCNLSGGKINVENKGMTVSFGRKPNVENMARRFGVGGGHGSVLIITDKLTMNANTRIGATYTGDRLGGNGYDSSGNAGTTGGGWKGVALDSSTTGGGGGSGGKGTVSGGFAASTSAGGKMGANVLIIADTITNFNIAAISTGGQGAYPTNAAANGGCGYGGGGDATGGGVHGGGAGTSKAGGAAGTAFIYCNNAVNQNLSGIVVSE